MLIAQLCLYDELFHPFQSGDHSYWRWHFTGGTLDKSQGVVDVRVSVGVDGWAQRGIGSVSHTGQ